MIYELYFLACFYPIHLHSCSFVVLVNAATIALNIEKFAIQRSTVGRDSIKQNPDDDGVHFSCQENTMEHRHVRSKSIDFLFSLTVGGINFT